MRGLRTVVALVIALAGGIIASSASAQLGQSEPLPFTEFVGAVRERGGGIDPANWDALNDAYRRYLDGCEALQTGRAGDVREEPPPMSGNVRPWFSAAMARLRPQRALDEALIEAAVAQLPVEAQDRAPILRAWLERRWLLEVSSWNDRTAGRYVPGELRRSRLKGDDREIAKRAIDELEVKVVVLERKRLEELPRAWQAANQARAALGPRPTDDDEHPEAVQDWRNARRVALRAATRDLVEISRDIDATVDRAVTNLLPQLSLAGRRIATTLVMALMYDGIDRGEPSDALRPVRAWLQRRDIPKERRDQARAMLERWRDDDDRAVADLLHVARRWQEARYDDLADPLPDGQDRCTAVEAEAQGIAERRRALAQAACSRIAAECGIKLEAEQPDDEANRQRADPDDPLFAGFESDDEEEDNGGEVEQPRPLEIMTSTEWCSAPRSREHLARFLDRFEPDPVRRAVFETLYADLESTWAERVIAASEAVGNVNLMRDDRTFDPAGPARLTAAARGADAAGYGAKRDFIEGVMSASTDEEHDAILVWRLAELLGESSWALERRSHLPTAERGPGPVRRHENLARAALDARLSNDDRALAEHVLAPRCEALERADRALVDAEIDAHVALLALRYEIKARVRAGAFRDQQAMEAASQAYAQEERAIARRLANAAAERVALSDEALQALAAALPEAAMLRVRRTLLKQGYPGIEEDKPSLEHIALRALSLESLEPERIARVAEAVERWRDEYEGLTDRLADLGLEPRPNESGYTMPVMEHGQLSNWVRFRREQCNEMMRHALACALTERERKAVGRLPAP